ncbi:DNA-primase RepB domain-containing protein [Paenibacillus sp. 481]|uniref:DNA-primase RepB domain-containing protein n=1 Tax=Paenibacillus sp. 481 TaxID=2835869 RepID=UPI001E3DECDB|nr:DNA-primase RepB domain-containing protein [Paenibacillus sp. 481]UHA75097.1 hypothetical protein KIK04_08775 [Paenibacillus sp. 481]
MKGTWSRMSVPHKAAKYALRTRQIFSDTHQFITKLRYKDSDQLRLLLVSDAQLAVSHYAVKPKKAYKIVKSLSSLEKNIAQTQSTSSSDNSDVMKKNASGYAICMVINKGGTKDHEINNVQAQFIDVDLNKVKETFTTKPMLQKRIEELNKYHYDPLDSFTVKKNKHGGYQFTANRSDQRIVQLKRRFLRKHWAYIKNALIVETYNGYHVYWPIKNGDTKQFVAIQDALARRFDSDPAVKNLARVMRLPGFYHMKNPKKPFMVRVIQWGRSKPFTQQELIKKLSLVMNEHRSKTAP